MENYIMLQNRRINLTAEQVAEIKQSFGLNQTKLADIAPGEVFKLGEYEFVVLEHSKDTTAVVLKNPLAKIIFGNTNDFNGSSVDSMCKDFGKKLKKIVGKGELVEHTVDLTANDGLTCYGKVRREVSLLTANLYRRYVEILDRHPVDKWWWLATPFGTPKHKDVTWVECVSPLGGVCDDVCSNSYGVRPFCIFASSILVSRE